MKNIEEHAAENVNKILLGNKCDLVEKRVVDAERGKKLAESYGIAFMETSAKNATNVEEAFFHIAREIKTRLIDSQDNAAAGASSVGADNVRLPPSDTQGHKEGRKVCC